MSNTPTVEITVFRHGLAFTTYQPNRLFLIGLKSNGELSGLEQLFDRPMDLHESPHHGHCGGGGKKSPTWSVMACEKSTLER